MVASGLAAARRYLYPPFSLCAEYISVSLRCFLQGSPVAFPTATETSKMYVRSCCVTRRAISSRSSLFHLTGRHALEVTPRHRRQCWCCCSCRMIRAVFLCCDSAAVQAYRLGFLCMVLYCRALFVVVSQSCANRAPILSQRARHAYVYYCIKY